MYTLFVGRDEKRTFKRSNNPAITSNINNNNNNNNNSTSKYYQRSDTPGSNSISMMNPTPSKDFHRITGIDLDEMKKLR